MKGRKRRRIAFGKMNYPFLKGRYKDELKAEVAFIKRRYEEGKREKAEGRTIPAKEVFAKGTEF